MTTKQQISDWFDVGQERFRYMVVVWDKWDNDDFPVYYLDQAEALIAIKDFRDNEFLEVVEVYDLKMDKGKQLEEFRAWHLNK